MNCQSLHIVLFCLWIFVECCLAVRFSDFEDFLMNHRHDTTTTQQPDFQASGSSEEGSGESDFLAMTTTTLVPTTLPRTRMTCCELGKLAGQNNFHCNPNNYGPQMHERNPNRAYGNFKRNRPSNRHAFTQVKQFSKCISGHVRELAWDFQMCCKQAYKEETRRDEMILELPINVHDNNKPSRTIFKIEKEGGDSQKVAAILGVELADEQQQMEDNSRSRYYRKKHHNRRS